MTRSRDRHSSTSRARRPAVEDRVPAGAGRSGAGRWLGLAAVFLLLAGMAWWAFPDRGLGLVPRADQNVLIVTIDALRADVPSFAGGLAPTEVLDGLTRQGVWFTFAHTHAAATLPAHVSLMTGRLPFEHGVRDDEGYRLSAATPTLASRLRDVGFTTGAFVGSAVLGRTTGLDAGFDVYDDRMMTRADPLDLMVAERPADRVVRAALNWLGQQTGRWFTWIHLAEPHAPYDPPEAFRTRVASDPYLGEVAAADAALEPLIRQLETGDRPTLVIVTADHGEGRGEHAEETHGLFGYETTLRVPLIVSWIDPASRLTRGGFAVDGPARLIDVVPTVLAAVGLPADSTVTGASLDPVMRDRDVVDRPTYFESMSAHLRRGWAPLRGVIVGRDKYIDLPVPELYDLATDTGELRNRAQVDPDRAGELKRRLDAWDAGALARPAGAATPPGAAPGPEDDPKRLVDLDRLMDAALLAFEDGRFEDAAGALQQVIVARPGNAEAYLTLARVFWQGGRPDGAIATLQAALDAGLTWGGVQVKLARMLALTSGGERAIALLEGRTGDDLDALGALGIAYTQVGRTADAERVFERMLVVEPNQAMAHENLGILRLRQDRLADAEVSLRRAIAIEPLTSDAYTPLGVVLSEQGRIDEAIDMWTQAVDSDAAEPLALFNLTIALASQGRVEEARARGEQFLRTAPPALYAEQIAQVRNLLGGR